MKRTVHPLLFAVLLGFGCEAELEIKGNTERVVGEKVTIELLEGETTLSGEVTLKDARKKEFDSTDLAVSFADERNLSFVIPAGVAQGAATAQLKKRGEDSAYALPLSISRLVACMYADGTVELLPLRPSPLAPQTIPPWNTTGTSRELAISPTGGLLVTLVGNQLAFHVLGKEITYVAPIVAAEGMLAALPSGAVVATSSNLQVWSYRPGEGTVNAGALAMPAGETIRAISTSGDGNWLVLLTSCASAAEGDCVVQVDLRAATPTRAAEVRLDDTMSATLISARTDGTAALVADGPWLYGVAFSGGSGQVTSTEWPGAAPTAIARTITLIEGQDQDLFAVVSTSPNAVRMVGFKDDGLRDISLNTIDIVPEHVSFGRGPDFFIVNGLTIYSASAGATLQLTERLVAPSAPPVRFAVQP